MSNRGKKWNPIPVIVYPTKVLKCPNGCEFDHKSLEGKEGWIVWDFGTGVKMKRTDCTKCGAIFDGINLPLDQGFRYLVILPDDMKPNGDFAWEDTYPLAPEDVQIIEKVEA